MLARLLGRNRKPPSIVWICADDYTPAVSGAYGSPLARTPNLDRLAAQGIRFDRAYCACPLSTPSRMSFLTGRYPRSVGVTLTPTPLPEDEVTIGRMLRDAGYEAVAVGKTHYYDPLLREFDRCIDLPEHDAYLASTKPGLSPQSVKVLGPWRPFGDPASVWLNGDCLPYAFDAEMPDTFFSEIAGRFLAQWRPKPFFLELCGIEPSPNVQGRSLAALLRGDTLVHREHVISEYADNAEAMVRTDRWKLIYSAGNRRRRDGYAIDDFPMGPTTRLYNLAEDPCELTDVAHLPENRVVVAQLLDLLARHMIATARDPATLPNIDDRHAILAQCLAPSDRRLWGHW
jgi:arylsulfatase A-like enzyme